jgi:glutamate-ammonia-ligase adenylyltransferase
LFGFKIYIFVIYRTYNIQKCKRNQIILKFNSMPEIINNIPKNLAEKAHDLLTTWLTNVRKIEAGLVLSSRMEAAVMTAFAGSNFVAQSCRRNPEILLDLIQTKDLRQPYSAGTHKERLSKFLDQSIHLESLSAPSDKELSLEQFESYLRRYRKREMVRVAFRDLVGWSDLQETLLDLSELADACIQSGLNYLAHRYIKKQGITPNLIVIGMGKLGARELNFSSDVDLILAFSNPVSDKPSNDGINMETACLTIGRELVQLLARNTADGFVFRVDTRLRPYGESGPLVMSCDNLESYYQAQGREWERYAMIKARVIAGDFRAGKILLDRLKPFVYRRYLDFGVFESIRDMKQKIRLEVRRKRVQHNIKIGAGGIREIEFFGQIFQLIRGGVLIELQERRILEVLRLLAQHRIVPQKVCQELAEAYEFFRKTENRLQEMDDRQTHLLPADPLDRLRLAFSMGFKTWSAFEQKMTFYRDQVHDHFNQLLGKKEKDDPFAQADETLEKLQMVWQDPLDKEDNVNVLLDAGYDLPKQAQIMLARFKDDIQTRALSATGRKRLNHLMPFILKKVAETSQPIVVLNRILELLKSIQRRTSYLALLLEYPTALTHLVRLSEASSWIVTFLSRHPVLLDELLDPRTLYSPPTADELRNGLKLRLGQEPYDDLDFQMESLRIFKHINILRVASSDITNVLPLMKVSDRLSDIATVILDHVVEISWQYLVKKHGRPQCRLAGQMIDKGFAVVAYGKLGGFELGYGSDLDLVFLHCAKPGQTQGGLQSIDNTQFFARLGQRVIHILSAHTAAGVLYDVDMRLRPSGSAGVLVSQVDGYRNYQLQDAWIWEHQALIRARAICGNQALMQRFEAIRKEVLTHGSPAKQLRVEVIKMRAKMRRQHLLLDRSGFDLKQGPGGLVDIEFLVQYLVLLNASKYPKIVDWTDNVRLLQSLLETKIVDELTAYRLRRAYLLYRAVIHRCNLQEKSAMVDANQFLDLRQWVQKIWNHFLG